MRVCLFKLIFTLLIFIGMGFASISPGMAQTLPDNLTKTQIQAVNDLRQKAFSATNRGDLAGAEGYWTQLIELLPDNPVGWSNRGNIKVGQNRIEAAIADYEKAIELAPDAPDAYLNRGLALERLSQWDAAIADYNRVLELDPEDPLAFNNRGNAKAGRGEWAAAIADYKTAIELAPNFATARANQSLALYQLGKTQTAIRTLRNLVRKYPRYPDTRAALTAALWVEGKQGEAESQWVSVLGLDSRYKDIEWVRDIRRWPPAMVAALNKFLQLQ